MACVLGGRQPSRSLRSEGRADLLLQRGHPRRRDVLAAADAQQARPAVPGRRERAGRRARLGGEPVEPARGRRGHPASPRAASHRACLWAAADSGREWQRCPRLRAPLHDLPARVDRGHRRVAGGFGEPAVLGCKLPGAPARAAPLRGASQGVQPPRCALLVVADHHVGASRAAFRPSKHPRLAQAKPQAAACAASIDFYSFS